MKKTVIALLAALSICIVPAVSFAAELVGYINPAEVMSKHPKFASVQKQIAAFADQKEKEVDKEVEKAKDDKTKEQIIRKKAREVADKENALMQPIFKDVSNAVQAAAKASGCKVVVNMQYVVCGGIDLTKDAIAKLK